MKDNEIEKLDIKVNELDVKLEDLSKSNDELNNQIQNLNTEVNEKNKTIENLNSQINALRKVISDYDNSLSWKVTKPLRYISTKSRNLLKKTKNNVLNIQSSNKINIYDEKVKKLNISNPKKVSVVIPNYNYADYIIERIDSVLLQTYPIYEIVILDDCSKDNSIEVIKNKIKTIKNANIRLVENETNGGSVFGQWKKGFNLVTGDYVWIAEADDSSNPRFLETVMEGFYDEKTVISYCESLTIDPKNSILMRDLREWIDIFNTGKWNENYIAEGKSEITSTIGINNTIANVSSVVFKKANYDEFFDKAREFTLAGDWYFYIKVLEQGKVAYFKESLNYHRMHNKGVTLTTKNEKHYEEICYIQDYVLNNYELTDEVKERIYARREEVKRRFNIE